jgi:hypothetical protein
VDGTLRHDPHPYLTEGMLRAAGIEPPKFHDVGGLLVEQRVREQLEGRPDVEVFLPLWERPAWWTWWG